jgi:D-aspartate ligase
MVARRPIDVSTPIVVLKMSRNMVQHGVLGIVRSAGRLGIAAHWVHNEALTPAAETRYLTKAHRLPQGPGGDERWLDLLVKVGRSLGGRPVLVATDDPSSVLLAEHADHLKSWFRFAIPPDGLVQSLADKRRLHEMCLGAGVSTPAARFPNEISDLEAYASEGTFPVVLKRVATATVEAAEALVSVRVVRSAGELREITRLLDEALVPNLMLQEYIPGGAESVWMFDGYFDDESVCLAGFTGRKVRQHPPHTGMASLGACEHNPDLIATTERFMRAVGFRGIVDMGYRFDRRDGSYKLLDVNPRIGATFRLFVDRSGTDVLRAMYLDLTGQPASPRLPVVERRRWMVEHHDARSALASAREGSLDVRTWLSSLRGVRETAWFSPRDPLPALALCAAFARIRAKRLAVAGTANRRGEQDQATNEPEASVRDNVLTAQFDSQADYWRAVYDDPGLDGAIYRLRQRRVLEVLDRLGSSEGARVLEIGPGAGLVTVELARRGYRVCCLDRAGRMLESAHALAAAEGVGDRVETVMGDVHALPFPDSSFDLVVAVGVVPWLEVPVVALRELRRVLVPDGAVVLTSDNRARLNFLLDPRLNPVTVEAAKRADGMLVRRFGVPSRRRPESLPRRYLNRAIDDMLADAGLVKGASESVGFGPFSVLRQPVGRGRRAVRAHERLQRLADAGAPGLRGVGAHYIVAARRPPVASPDESVEPAGLPQRSG